MDDLDSFRDNNCWDLPDFDCFVSDVSPSPDLFLDHQSISFGPLEVDGSHYGATSRGKECLESECHRKRGRGGSCSKLGSKACREKQRREKLNDRFAELCSVIDPERPVKTDKMAILGDAIRVVNQLKTESREYTEMNEKLLEEIKTLKAEKNELREEKQALKADKERLEQQVNAISVPPYPTAAYHQPGPNKIAVMPSYGFLPMWHYLPPSTRDTSQDHELRPPAA